MRILLAASLALSVSAQVPNKTVTFVYNAAPPALARSHRRMSARRHTVPHDAHSLSPHRYQLNQSTVLMPCNNSGYTDPARTAGWAIIDFVRTRSDSSWSRAAIAAPLHPPFL